jgi:hypothetical protein
MKVFLPFIIVVALLLVVISPGVQKFSGTADVASAAVTPTVAPAAAPSVDAATPPDGTWVKDADVTFVGKTAARSGSFLDWSLANYNWVSLGTTDTNPLVDFWRTVRNIVYAFFSLFVLITAFVIMITRGKNITVMRFIPRFIGIILLVTFSFALVQFLYQVFDIIQGFFLRNPDCFAIAGSSAPFTPPAFCSISDKVSQANLLNVGFNYVDFIGYRQVGMGNDEAAVITLLLTKLTAVTYYVMVGVLIVRKIILWFFIIISPIFPLLLLYRPVRNTGKIWVGEFFRWLLYAPLFSVLLAGLVSLWRAGIPLFSYNNTGDIISKSGNVGVDVVYPTAINILLGGPKANISLQNSINLPETFALYVICLIMLWVVIILPFILLRIFLDYIFSVSLAENTSLKQVMSMANSFINKPPSAPSPVGPQPPPAGAGLARVLPFTKRFSVPEGVARAISDRTDRTAIVSRNASVQTNTNTNTNTTATTSRLSEAFTNRSQIHSVKETSEITKLTNLSVPTMRDIAKYETAQLSTNTNTTQRVEVTQVNQSLQKIANPTQTSTPMEREKYVQVREKLVTESQKGNVLATTILNAANSVSHSSVSNQQIHPTAVVKTVFKQLANPEKITNPTEREQYTQVKGKIVQENQNGNQVAASLLAYINNLSENTLASTQNISVDHVQKFLKNIASPISITDNTTKNIYTQLREQLQTQSKQGNTLATSVLNLSSTTTVPNPDQLTALKDQLVTAQKAGDPVATSVLSTVQKETGDVDVDKVREKLIQAQAKGDKVATVLLSLVDAKQQTGSKTTTSTAIPVVNRLQTVSLDDYEAVKKTWRESYKNIEVPQKMDKVQSRKEWLQSDIMQISSTINLLSSPDAEKRAEGMKEVSGILPFLLIGGFSQGEIVAYLKAKMEAAKDISGDLEEKEEEEGSLVDAKQKSAAHPQAMHMTTEVKLPQSTIGTTTSSKNEPEEETPSPLRFVTPNITQPVIPNAQPQSVQPAVSPTVTFNTQLLQLTNLSVPTMKDIARFETAHLEKQPEKTPEVITIKESLQKIATPQVVGEPVEQQKYQQIREKLTTDSQNGDALAASILTAANTFTAQELSATVITTTDIEKVLSQLFNPEKVGDSTQREQLIQVRNKLMEEKNNGNALASTVVTSATQSEKPTSEAVNTLHEQLVQPANMQNPVRSLVLSLLPITPEAKAQAVPKLPETNRIQSVNVDDYEAVKQIWKDSYKTVAYPQIDGKLTDRKQWIEKDMTDITNTISMLSNTDKEKQQLGMKKVSEILPFLLIGGFSQTEVVTYLKAKLEAAKDVTNDIAQKEQEEGSVLDRKQTVTQKPLEMSIAEEQHPFPVSTSQTPLTFAKTDEKKNENT